MQCGTGQRAPWRSGRARGGWRARFWRPFLHEWALLKAPAGKFSASPAQAAELAEYTAKIALLEEARRRKEDEVEEWQHRVSAGARPGPARRGGAGRGGLVPPKAMVRVRSRRPILVVLGQKSP